MQFIEELFGVSPDGGNGTLEFFLFLVPVILLVLFVNLRRARRRRAMPRH
jgi:hypothetical protein